MECTWLAILCSLPLPIPPSEPHSGLPASPSTERALTLGTVLCPGNSTGLAELSFHPGSVVHVLCDPRQVTSPLWT